LYAVRYEETRNADVLGKRMREGARRKAVRLGQTLERLRNEARKGDNNLRSEKEKKLTK
jgi:hypothetical protein